jgi:hypothetical protein
VLRESQRRFSVLSSARNRAAGSTRRLTTRLEKLPTLQTVLGAPESGFICFLKGTERTRGVILQNYYRKYYQDVVVTHQNFYKDPFIQEFMLDALDKPGPVDPDRALEDFELPLP